MSDGRIFRAGGTTRYWITIASLAVAFCGAQSALADFDFVGGDPSANANGTNSNFFNAIDGWVNTSDDYALAPPQSGPDPNTTGSATPTLNINTGVPDTGTLFDPAAQDSSVLASFGMTGTTFNTNGKVYINSNNSGPGSDNYASDFPSNPYTAPVANYFAIKSGEFHLNSANLTNSIMIIGRSAPGTLIIDGGTMVVDTSIQVAGDGSNFLQTGTIIYNGGVLNSGLDANGASNPGIRLGNGSACTANLVVYNKGAGNITLGSLYVAKQTSNGTVPTVGNIEFHLDNGGTRPIQIHNSDGTAQLSIRNGSGQSSRLNLVLDSSPSMTLVNGIEVPQNLGLFSDDIISGNDITTEYFYDSTGTTLLSDGTNGTTATTITERAPNGYTDTWAISYQGTITFSDAANSVVSSVTGPNNLLGDSTVGGHDVVLMGVSAIPPVIGDANGDGAVNSLDLGIWKSNDNQSVTGGYADADFNVDGIVNQDDLSIFDYGAALYNASHSSVPEPASAALALLALPLCGGRRRRTV